MQPELIGYADRFSVASGRTIRFMVSTDSPEYDVQIVRLIHADENPKGPGFKEEAIESSANQRYVGRKQTTYPGSYVIVEHHPALDELKSFALQAWIYPTTPAKGEVQGIISKWANDTGFVLVINENGEAGLWLGSGNGQVERIYSGAPMRAREWYLVRATFDSTTGEATVGQQPLSPIPTDSSEGWIHPTLRPTAVTAADAPLLIGAAYGEKSDSGHVLGRGTFNGKIDHPRILSLESSDVVAAWDFSTDISSAKVTDTGPRGLHGTAINSPARGVTGHNWSGNEMDFKYTPEQYGAIHFHDDDLDDARWEEDFDLTIPDGWKSGVYAARLRAGDLEDHIPFFVRPPKGKPRAKALYLIPTMTYLAYANYHKKDVGFDDNGTQRQPAWQPIDQYLKEHPELAMSIYDYHNDSSGCHYSTRLRPIINMRAKFSWGLVGGPRHFSADLYLVDWLEARGFDYDVVTDEDLHFDGLELLQDYKVVITGTHPEYWTTPMLDSLDAYLSEGGRLMYLGGNGFYWVTSVDAEKPHVVEVRRGIAGTRAWESPPGELYHSTTGEPGGLWRYRGRAPNKVAGIGFTAQGWNGTAPGYTRQPGSFDPRAAFIFEGIGADEIIGNFGLGLGGAAGDEVDRVDARLGTPAHTLVLASSSGHPDGVIAVIEDYRELDVKFMARENWQVRADMVYFETPNNGAVFSTGSISWCSTLSHNGYDNNASRVTENVLRKFLI
jgi:N,N-dimethylformamidase